MELSHHFRLRTLVFEELRILYVPVPKASCTGLLWLLAEAAGLPKDHFLGSSGGEVTPSLTVHDLSQWPNVNRFGLRRDEVQQQALNDDDWLRFTVVRHPYTRLWSAWQSKILLAEPQFIEKFSERAWFPDAPGSAENVEASFRDFLDGMHADPDLVNADVHWAPQAELISYDQVAYRHVGHVEKLTPTLELLGEHLRSLGRDLPTMPRTNRNPVPYSEKLYDEADVELLQKLYAGDLTAFGYHPPDPAAVRGELPEDWRATANSLVPALQELRERNSRVGALRNRTNETEEKLLSLRERHQATRLKLQQRTEKLQRLKEDRQKLRDLRRKDKEVRQQERERKRADRAQIRRLRKDLATSRAELKAMRHSASWRYTKPIRAASRRVKRLRQRVMR